MMIRVLLPLDCSFVDDAVLKMVEKLIPHLESELLLLRVIHAHTRDTLTEEREKAQRCLHQAADRLGKQGLTVRMKTVEGEVASAIIRVAEDESCNLIAMATHGHHSWERFLLGSVADVLRHRSSIPLLLVNARTHKDQQE